MKKKFKTLCGEILVAIFMTLVFMHPKIVQITRRTDCLVLDCLGISPSKEKFTRVLTNTLKGIPGVLCANAVPMDGSITDPNTDAQTVLEEQEAALAKHCSSDVRYILFSQITVKSQIIHKTLTLK